MSADPNRCGRATALTALTRVRWWGRLTLPPLFWLGQTFPWLSRTLARLSFIHFARWALVRRLPGGPRLRPPVLLFESNFNGDWDQYIDAFAHILPGRMKRIWGSSEGFPGPLPVGPFKAYIRAHELPAAHYWSAYPEASATMIASALRVREGLAALRRDAPSLSPDAFRARYEALLTDRQRDL